MKRLITLTVILIGCFSIWGQNVYLTPTYAPFLNGIGLKVYVPCSKVIYLTPSFDKGEFNFSGSYTEFKRGSLQVGYKVLDKKEEFLIFSIGADYIDYKDQIRKSNVLLSISILKELNKVLSFNVDVDFNLNSKIGIGIRL